MAILKKRNKELTGTNLVIVNENTGEVIGTAPSFEDRELLHRTIQIEDIYEEEGEPKCHYFNPSDTFIKSFRGNGNLFRKHLAPNELMVLMFLTDYLCYNDCILRVGGNRQGSILTVEQLADLYGLRYDSFRRIMSELKKKEFLSYHDKNTLETTVGIINQRCITLNPYIFCRGTKVDDYVASYYRNSIWSSLERPKNKNEQLNKKEKK